eukprot:maker-scaffold12_size759060-snap-gene-4.10 protein:Tk05572 transcript:maker-scaffold12_size759060-snap-gene-4.10-mRNA-1 annotation:"hypothetical protein CRE_17595"
MWPPLDYGIWGYVDSKACRTLHESVSNLKASVEEHWAAMDVDYVGRITSNARFHIKETRFLAKDLRHLDGPLVSEAAKEHCTYEIVGRVPNGTYYCPQEWKLKIFSIEEHGSMVRRRSSSSRRFKKTKTRRLGKKHVNFSEEVKPFNRKHSNHLSNIFEALDQCDSVQLDNPHFPSAAPKQNHWIVSKLRIFLHSNRDRSDSIRKKREITAILKARNTGKVLEQLQITHSRNLFTTTAKSRTAQQKSRRRSAEWCCHHNLGIVPTLRLESRGTTSSTCLGLVTRMCCIKPLYGNGRKSPSTLAQARGPSSHSEFEGLSPFWNHLLRVASGASVPEWLRSGGTTSFGGANRLQNMSGITRLPDGPALEQ